MADGRFILISVAYDRGADYDASLEWIAPELKDAGMSLIENDADGPGPSLTWAGTVDGPTFEQFADAWHLNGETLGDTGGHPGVHAYTFDGMNWETCGESAITYATVHVS